MISYKLKQQWIKSTRLQIPSRSKAEAKIVADEIIAKLPDTVTDENFLDSAPDAHAACKAVIEESPLSIVSVLHFKASYNNTRAQRRNHRIKQKKYGERACNVKIKPLFKTSPRSV